MSAVMAADGHEMSPYQKPAALVWCTGCVDCSNWKSGFQGGRSAFAHLQGELGALMSFSTCLSA